MRNLALAFLLLITSVSTAAAQWTRVSAPTTLNVDCTSGDDSESITVAQRLAGTAFKSPVAASKFTFTNLDLNGFDLTVQIADNVGAGLIACTKGAILNGLAVGQATRWDTDGKITFRGNMTDPSKVVIEPGAPWVAAFEGSNGASFFIEGLTVKNVYNGIHSLRYSTVWVRKVYFVGNTNSNLYANLGYIEAWGDQTIQSGSAAHAVTANGGTIALNPGTTVTLQNTPNFSAAFAYVINLGFLVNSATYSGTATGKKYYADTNSVLLGSTTLPGDAPGVSSRGAQVAP